MGDRYWSLFCVCILICNTFFTLLRNERVQLILVGSVSIKSSTDISGFDLMAFDRPAAVDCKINHCRHILFNGLFGEIIHPCIPIGSQSDCKCIENGLCLLIKFLIGLQRSVEFELLAALVKPVAVFVGGNGDPLHQRIADVS